MLVSMAQQEKEKLNNIIKKMGDKIMSLEELNHTLKENLKKNEEGES